MNDGLVGSTGCQTRTADRHQDSDRSHRPKEVGNCDTAMARRARRHYASMGVAGCPITIQMFAVHNQSRRRDRRLASRLYAATGGVWIFLHLLGLLGPLSKLTFVALTASSITACLFGMRRYRPRLRWPFLMVVVGFVLLVVGGAAREILKTLG